MNAWARALMLGTLTGLAVEGCGESPTHRSSAAPSATTTPLATLFPASATTTGPEPRKGMSYIPPGALVTGSPPSSLPRRPDRELSGEQMMLKGYYIDRFAYPNEEGAIALTNVSQPEAVALCQKAGKRLCTELEWERACKGPENHRYPWGERYRADTCQFGALTQAHPSGMSVGCHSDFDVFDLAGGVFEWTQSPWRRGTSEERFVLKGGSGVDGELVGRCANAESSEQARRSGQIGFRCCYGPVNSAEVVIQAKSGEAVERLDSLDRSQFERLTNPKTGDEQTALPPGRWNAEQAYLWRPVSNETLIVYVLCQRSPNKTHCGILVGRDTPEEPLRLAFADTGAITSSLHMDSRSERLWLIGLDAQGTFKRKLLYQGGRIVVGSKERHVPNVRRRHER